MRPFGCKRYDGFPARLQDKRLPYGSIEGSPKLLSGAVIVYRGIAPENAVPAHGGIRADDQVINV